MKEAVRVTDLTWTDKCQGKVKTPFSVKDIIIRTIINYSIHVLGKMHILP